jgi:hypothetical protein
VEFRLHRFDSHLRQHTIQIERTLQQLGVDPTESKRLLRLIYNALAQAEGYAIGIEPVDNTALSSQILARARELADILAGDSK